MRPTLITAFLVAACVAVLLADYSVATRRAPQDARLIKSLQQQVKSDAALAPKLAAQQARITAARRARKSRDNAVACLLIGAAAAFLTFANRLPYIPRRAMPRAAGPSSVLSFRPRRPRAEAPGLDLAFIDSLVAQYGRSRESTILFLQAIQSHYRYLPDEALQRLCELTEITPAQIAGTSSFYAQFRRSPMGRHHVRVCHGTACHVAGARQINEELRRYLAIPAGADTDPQRLFTVDEVACVGCCSLAPVLMLDGQTAGRLTPAGACGAVERYAESRTA